MTMICWDIDANEPAECGEHEECREYSDRRQKQEADNRAYLAAKCEEPHEDGSTCMPSWDGFVYVCLDRIARSA